MLESLAIQNFQAHDKTRIDFDPGITCIVGPSDVGKSAILRALRWVCANEPGGDAFIRHGAKGATVRLAVAGHTVTRRRSPGGDVNEYALDDQQFKAFGRGVPEPILRLLDLGPVCWQGQHDAPYWFAETAGEVSRQLNSIVNLGVIDDVLAKVATARNRARTRLDVAEEALTTAKRTHTELGWVDGFAAAVSAIEVVEAAHVRAATQAAQARLLCTEAVKLGAARDNAACVAQAGQKAVETGAEALRLRTQATAAAGLVGQAREFKQGAGVVVPDTWELDALHFTARDVRSEVNHFKNILHIAKQRERDLCKAQEELNALEADLKTAEKAMRKQTCPTCGRSS